MKCSAPLEGPGSSQAESGHSAPPLEGAVRKSLTSVTLLPFLNPEIGSGTPREGEEMKELMCNLFMGWVAGCIKRDAEQLEKLWRRQQGQDRKAAGHSELTGRTSVLGGLPNSAQSPRKMIPF